jgi:hypothetical protein
MIAQREDFRRAAQAVILSGAKDLDATVTHNATAAIFRSASE